MKRVFEHPPQPTRSAYWKSLEEYADTPEFRQWMEREFPQGASEFEGMSRRSFIRLMGASLALAGLGLSGCRRPEAHILPYTHLPEWQVTGKHLRYATAMPRRRGASPLLVTTFNGRPIKIEGNPLHAVAKGKSDTYAQASILDLYDPDRSQRFLRKDVNGKLIGAQEIDFLTTLKTLREEWLAKQGAGLVVLANEELSPTRDRLRAELQRALPQMLWVTDEPLMSGEQRRAVRASFGQGVEVRQDISKAKVILSVDCDFLGTDEGGMQAVREFAEGRRVHQVGDTMNRLYAVESRYTLTGASAEHRLRLKTSHATAFMALLVRECMEQGVSGLEAYRELVKLITPESLGIDPAWVRECVADLIVHGGKSLVLVGARQTVTAQVLGFALNQALGNFGQTQYCVTTRRQESASMTELFQALDSKQVQTLVILGTNPLYHGASDIDWQGLLAKVPTVIQHSLQINETSAVAHWHVPSAHYLESWSDAYAEDGSVLSIQPMILPLWGGWTQNDLLARMLGRPQPEGPELVKETFRSFMSQWGKSDFDATWSLFVRDGFVSGTEAKKVSTSFNTATASQAASTADVNVSEDLEIVFTSDYSMDDGRFNNNAWMHEWADPMTKLTWENAALISPATAQQLGVSSPSVKGIVTGDIIRIERRGRVIEAPILVAPGHADNSVTLPLGYGRTETGRVGRGSGFNAYALRTAGAPYVAFGAKISLTGRKHQMAVTQDHFSMEGRALVREAPLEHFEKHPDFVNDMGVEAHSPPIRSVYQSPPLDAPHQWAMSIDLNTCTGCNACVVACQSENNIPIVGKEQVKKGREMHWIRIDRYFSSDVAYNQDRGELPSDPQVLMQPVTCMHCENAPCETVCPVNATVHNEEGLNVMAYNRCIGTRYCANNCPYKVRRFNFFDYNQRPNDYAKGSTYVGPIPTGQLYRGPLTKKGMDETLKMQKNPNVTVRMRGVMEKCTFCVQRIQEAKIEQKVQAGASADIMVREHALQTACQQACPSDAIVFGNKSDASSRVSHLISLPHSYGLLDYLNTKPRVRYLARLRNPNMKMPGADKIGMSSLAHAHAESHGGTH